MRLLTLFLLISTVAEAKPWYRDPKVLALGTAAVVSTVMETREGHECRQRADVGHCLEGYGPFAARQSVKAGLTLGFFGLSVWARHDGHKEWPIYVLPMIGYNTYSAVSQYYVPADPCRHTTLSCGDSVPDRFPIPTAIPRRGH